MSKAEKDGNRPGMLSRPGAPRRIIVKGTEHVLVDRFDLPRIGGYVQVDNLTTGRRQLEGDRWPFKGFMDLPMEVRR